MHGNGSTRVERVIPNAFWGKSKSVCAHLLGLGSDDGDDIRGADRAETLIGRIVVDWGGEVASVFSQAEEDIDTRSNWAGCWGL